MKSAIAIMFAAMFAHPCLAQVKPSAEITEVVRDATASFLDHIQNRNHDAAREFFSEELRALTPADEWHRFRNAAHQTTGAIASYQAYKITYYPGTPTGSAVDFVGKTEKPGMFVCGYLAWNVLSSSEVQLSRFEHNAVDVKIFQRMPVRQAAQTLVNWRCPKPLIEAMLGVSLP